MAIRLINSQGTKLLVAPVPPNPDALITPYDWAMYIKNNAKITQCPQTLGDLPESRNLTEYGCISTNDSVKSVGSIQRGNFDVELLFDPDDTDGMDLMRDSFYDNTELLFAVEFPDSATQDTYPGNNGTMEYFYGYVSSHTMGVAQNEAVRLTLTVEVSSEIKEIDRDILLP